jgi:hypothetical protein
MARPRKFTDVQWAEAMRLYVTEGPRAAGALTGIDPSAITKRAKSTGTSTVVIARTHEATLAMAAKRAVGVRRTIGTHDLSFGGSAHGGLCLHFREAVHVGRLRVSDLYLTVDDLNALGAALSVEAGLLVP